MPNGLIFFIIVVTVIEKDDISTCHHGLINGYLVTSYLVTAGGSVVIDAFIHLESPDLVGLFGIFPWGWRVT